MTRLVLLPSPLLGQTAWQPAAEELRARGWVVTVAKLPGRVAAPEDVLAGFLAATPDEPRLVLVPHSNAGLYVGAIAAQRDVAAAVFVDATIPGPDAAVAPAELLAHLETLADADGLLPPWTRWWPEDEVAALFPDEETRRRVEADQARLPLAYFKSAPPRQQWTGRSAYLAFGDSYAPQRRAAAERGWPVRTLPGEHLHMLVDPPAVAAAVAGLLADLEVKQQR